ncbi:MAG TPA: TonB-dependent receptor plug domain-containing protein, partial [Hanamia sp.]|nr:TonB-dependent receptor plug domain-containing protein [Hanamia sp.]
MNPNTFTAFHGKRFLSRLFSLIFGITLFVPYQLFAQTTTVTGQIKSSDGTGIAGVSVQEKGSKNGTATNTSGSFSLNVTNPNATLEISSLGYTSQDIPLSGRSSISVTLAPSSAKSLDQVVIVGYGSQRKKYLTGAVSVISSADISDRPIVNVGEALQGKAAGVEVTSNSGKPGAGLTIRVRGSSSISAGNDPLYVVDGVPLTDISAFSPDDIESISILKDAASASIYGTRAANGV